MMIGQNSAKKISSSRAVAASVAALVGALVATVLPKNALNNLSTNWVFNIFFDASCVNNCGKKYTPNLRGFARPVCRSTT